MHCKRILAVSISILIECIYGFYLEASANYLKPKLERNNIVNKKVWVRNRYHDDSVEKTNAGNFIFRPDSMDAGFLQNAYDRFGENALQASPQVTGYVQRSRRSPEIKRKRRPRKGLKTKKRSPIKIEDSAMIKSKIVSDLKPASLFNEYPYEVAMLLNNGDKGSSKVTNKHKNSNDNETKSKTIEDSDKLNVIPVNSTVKANAVKRSKKFDQDVEENYRYGYNEAYNNTDVDTNNIDRSVFDKDERIWTQNAPIPDSNMYKVVSKEPESISEKGVTERGLIRVISMLTRSFKKIMRHQREIKTIHDKLIKISGVFDRKASEIYAKFVDFDSKYNDMVQFSKHFKEIETNLNAVSEDMINKCKHIEDTFTEFKDQQKKFLAQQRQFFEIQKLMLAQNEKINAKQEQISKTQSKISLRQNNFARILKKAKEIILERKMNNSHKLDRPKSKDHGDSIISSPSANTQSMKINLFSIPPKNKLTDVDQDELIIKEKDDKQIDDLVYKYYFNNTFIDNLMKSMILTNFATNTNSVDIARNAKNKRDDLETTLMIPIAKDKTKQARHKRWINSFGKKYRHITHQHPKAEDATVKDLEGAKSKDPFVIMATSFCKGIGQNTNEQTLKWCVEKALRKLKMIGKAETMKPMPVTVMTEKKSVTNKLEINTERQTREGIITLRAVPTTVLHIQSTAPVTKAYPVHTPVYPVSQKTIQELYFPDNDEMESKLKEYDLKPDTEGNVYYDGSVHISDFGKRFSTPTTSEGTSDLFPGLLDSDSRVDNIDPIAFDIQAQRAAFVSRMNEELMKKMRHAS